MVLGAGVYQLPLIRKVKEMGFRAVVVSIDGNYPGIPEADVFLPIDTTDIKAVVAAAGEYRIRAAVTTGTDVSVPALGAVNDALSLPGVSRKAATIVSRKNEFREFQKRHVLPHPRFVIAEELSDLKQSLDSFHGPFYCKPVDSSGSRGVTRVEDRSPDVLESVFKFARSFSRTGSVCCEEAMPGTEVGGNAVLFDDRIELMVITSKHMDGVIVRGHSLPTQLSPDDRAAVEDAICTHAAALGFSTGVLNFDIMVNQGTARVIEMGARPGGNGISDLIRRSLGYDMDQAVVDLALGRRPEAACRDATASCGTVVFGSMESGRLESVASLEEIRRCEPSVFDLRLAINVGEHVGAFQHNANLIGYAMFDIPAGRQYRSVAERVLSCLDILVT